MPVAARGYCRVHALRKERQARTPGAKQIYNSMRWRYARRAKLAQDPICERCDRALSQQVHHKVDLADDSDPFALEGLEALCASCHSRETRARQLAG